MVSIAKALWITVAAVIVIGLVVQAGQNENAAKSVPAAKTDVSQPPTNPFAGPISTPSKQPTKYDIMQQVVISKMSWRKGGFGAVMLLNGSIVNLSNYDVKDITIGCAHFAGSGTQLGTLSKTLYEAVPARGTKPFRELGMGFIHSQAARANCQVDDLVVGEERAPPPKREPKAKHKSAKPQ